MVFLKLCHRYGLQVNLTGKDLEKFHLNVFLQDKRPNRETRNIPGGFRKLPMRLQSKSYQVRWYQMAQADRKRTAGMDLFLKSFASDLFLYELIFIYIINYLFLFDLLLSFFFSLSNYQFSYQSNYLSSFLSCLSRNWKKVYVYPWIGGKRAQILSTLVW